MSSQSNQILVVDDDPAFLHLASLVLQKAGFVPLLAPDGQTALQKVRHDAPEVVLTDMRLPDMDGLELMQRIRNLEKDLPVVIITGYPRIPGAVQAMRAAAQDYLEKPIQACDLIRVVRRALAERRSKLELNQLDHRPSTNNELAEIMGPSEPIGTLIAEINCVSKSNFSVVILGETGSGKEVVARAIHAASARANHPFMPVDCGAIPETLLEDELFGHERGAFTGAVGAKRGKFELAQGGTLFLDEILNLPLGSQAKLLRVLQEKVVYHVGGSSPVPIDIRLLVAASQDLETAVATGAFRMDLYYRLIEFVLRVPALRERADDIVYLAKRFRVLTNQELHKAVKGFTQSALDAMLRYSWPGNVRQLRSTIRRAVLLADEDVTENHLDFAHALEGTVHALDINPKMRITAHTPLPLKNIVAQEVEKVERQTIGQALDASSGNKAKAARMLQIDYKTMQSKVKRYGISQNKNNHYENQEASL